MKIKKSYVSISFLLLIFSLTVIGANNQSLKPQYNLETPKTSAGEITIITPENKVYTEPDSGHFPSTYGFENDQAGPAPSGWVWAAPNGYVRVLDELDGFKKVVEAHKNSGGTPTYIRKYFEQASGTTGTVEFWFQKDTLGSGADASKVHFGSPGTEHIALGFQRGDIFVGDYGYSGDWTKIADNAYVANKWYHVRIDFDLSKGWQMNFNNGTIYGAGFAFAFEGGTPSAITYFHQYTHYSADHSSYSTFHDAISYSWDPSYEIGDNLKEGLLLSYENTTTFDWQGYSLDGQDNVTISGDCTIPVPVNGTHTIQVFGTDSIGTSYQSNLRYFAYGTTLIPEITIYSPTPNEFFNSIAPNYDIRIFGDYDTVWYTIDEGITNITITELIGSIDQTEWDKLGEGAVNLRFYVNNALGNSSYSEVTINKDTITPILSINYPSQYMVFGKKSPSFDLSIVELNISSMWYSLDSGSTNITFQEFTGTINQTEWDKCGNGTVNINFYVKDEANNEGSAQVSIIKEATPPIITVISPNENELFTTIAPTFEIDIQEANLDTTWYTLDDGLTNFIFTGLTGSIEQSEWDLYGNASLTLKFYANDTYGYQNFTQVIIHKDIIAPIITINSPQQDEVFSSIAPAFDITVIDSHLDSMWYTIDNGLTNIPITSTVGVIDQAEWNKKGEEFVLIKFYANDTLGNIAYSEVVVIKDTIQPVININSPESHEIFGDDPPSFDLSVVELNIDSMWYSLDGGSTNIAFQELTGTIIQNEWDKYGNGTITLQFYVSDLAGNIGFSEVVVYKDIIAPSISINSPNEFEIFASDAPSFSLSIIEPNLDAMWYTLDGGFTNININSLTGTIDQTEWNKFGNGTVTIQFYAIDLAGNEGMTQITIRKDIDSPIITIISPQQDEIYSSTAPAFDITVIDSQLDSMWYSLDNGLTNISITSTVGTIDQTEWNKKGGGIITIRFYASDTLGNIGYLEVIIIKDVIVPSISINSPSEFEVFGSSAPSFSLSIIESNLDSMWYTLDGGSTNMVITSLSGIIDQAEWDKFGNGTVTIQFFAMDLAGNIGVKQITVHKDISIPIITILSPVTRDFIGPNAPHFELSIQEPNIAVMWYTLDYGITNIYFGEITGVIDQTEWDKHGNGSVVIQFYIRDKGGNEAFSEVLINKDIYAPTITIENPELGEQFLDFSPIFSITIQEPNLVNFWYSLDNGDTNITLTELTGIINQEEWNTLPNGPITIRFYAKDKAGNIGTNMIIVTKLTTYIEPPPGIPGYDLIALIGVSSITTLILLRKKIKK